MFDRKNTKVRQAFKEHKVSSNLYYQYCTMLEKQVPESEEIEFLIPTFYVNEQRKKEKAFLTITSKSIMFIIGQGTKTHFIAFPRKELRSYSVIKEGLLKVSIIRFEFINETIDIKVGNTAHGEKITSILSVNTKNTEPKQVPKNVANEDPILALERLARLRDGGVITEQDFNRKKDDLLEKI